VEHWEPPKPSCCKVNTDGSFSPSDGTGGGGVVVRDHHGDFIEGACRFFTAVSDPEGAELKGVLVGAQRGKGCRCSEADSGVRLSRFGN
jgi:ribonuclease HI